MKMVIHSNLWKWGRSFDIIANDGTATISVSVTNDEPEQAYISGLSVWSPSRRKGLGTRFVNMALVQAKECGCKYAFIMADKDSFVFDWYKRMGFKYYGHKQDDNGFVPMYREI